MTFRRAAWIYCAAGAVVLTLQTPAAAHHSFAVYDHTRTVTLHGTVTKFQWTNPHAFLELDVKQPDGTTKHYSVELTSINMMQRVGWRSNMVKAGDQVTAVIAPLLSGEAVGLGLVFTVADCPSGFLPVRAAASFKRSGQAQ